MSSTKSFANLVFGSRALISLISWYILVAGEVEVSKNEVGVVNLSKAGDVIGEMGVLANQVRAANCTALVETTALHIPTSGTCWSAAHSYRSA